MMEGTRIMLMVVAAQLDCLLLHELDERDKKNADGCSSSARLLIVARA